MYAKATAEWVMRKFIRTCLIIINFMGNYNFYDINLKKSNKKKYFNVKMIRV